MSCILFAAHPHQPGAQDSDDEAAAGYTSSSGDEAAHESAAACDQRALLNRLLPATGAPRLQSAQELANHIQRVCPSVRFLMPQLEPLVPLLNTLSGLFGEVDAPYSAGAHHLSREPRVD